ncbi:MAG TPA: SH3 domain-containing protein [Candidatus Woesebacteria bacterium]|nr:SH3 domain-containing protein [Candidatus Woesebacteria bacterium]
MKTNYFRLVAVSVFSLLLAGCNLNPFAKKAGIQVTAHPDANVVINGESVGKTPYYAANKNAGSYTIQMTAIDSGQTWETKINLLGGTLSTVHREFGETQDKSHSYSLSFEKLSSSKASAVSVVSLPSNATTSIDGQPNDFTPLNIDIDSGPHVFTFTAPGYQDKIINANVQPGYRLLLNFTMAALDITPTPTPTIATPSATPTLSKNTTVTPLPKQATSSAVVAKPYVEILTTPTGWLKVRESASTSANELAKVNPGDKFPYKESDTTGWYYIEYTDGEWGYVSTTYAKLVK